MSESVAEQFDRLYARATSDPRRALLQEAAEIVTGDREDDYGHPRDNFRRVAILWNAYLDIIFEARGSYHLMSHDIAILEGYKKDCRLVHSPDHYDSWLDKAGGAACGFVCTDEDGDA